MKVHLYSCRFDNHEIAMRYATEMDYEIDDSIPELYKDIGATWLDEDFIETIYGEERFEYLSKLLIDSSKIDKIKATCPESHNTLFLIFAVKGTSNEEFKPHGTKHSKYVGAFNASFD